MSLQLDPRLNVAVDESSALRTLNTLNQQILSRRDPGVLPELLGKYVALAARRTGAPRPLPSATNLRLPIYADRLTKADTTISNILKKTNDTATAILNNLK